MKKKINARRIIKLSAFTSIISGVFFVTGWPFFHFITYGGGKKTDKKKKEDSKKEVPKESDAKWFALNHTKVNHPKYKHLEEYESCREWCEKQPMEDWYIRSRDGLRLHASYYPVENPKRFVVLVHGYRGTRFGSVAHIAKELREAGCSMLFIDQRCCGESEGKYITFGAKEQYDVIDWLQRLEWENPNGLPVYLYGQSMGAGTVLMSAGRKLPHTVKGIIADCGIHSMKDQLRDIAAVWFHLHGIELLLFRVNMFCRLFGKFSMRQADTTKALKKNKIPVLFFHGEDDTYVTPESTLRNYVLCTAEKELVLIPEARHLCCSYEQPELYKEKVFGFFEKHDKSSV